MKVEVEFDADKQAVGVKFEPAEFKTWDFLIAVLGMAVEQAKERKRMATLQAMQAQQVAAQEQAAVKRILSNGR